MNETHDNGNCNIMNDEERELETDIDCDQTPSLVNQSYIIENINELPGTVTTVTNSKDSCNNIHIKPPAPSVDGQGAYMEESDNIDNNTSILNLNDDLKTIDKNYDSDLTSDNNRLNPRIGKKGSLYYCKEHPKFQNIHLEEVENHLRYSKEHSQENPTTIPSYYNRDMQIPSMKDNLMLS